MSRFLPKRARTLTGRLYFAGSVEAVEAVEAMTYHGMDCGEISMPFFPHRDILRSCAWAKDRDGCARDRYMQYAGKSNRFTNNA